MKFYVSLPFFLLSSRKKAGLGRRELWGFERKLYWEKAAQQKAGKPGPSHSGRTRAPRALGPVGKGRLLAGFSGPN